MGRAATAPALAIVLVLGSSAACTNPSTDIAQPMGTSPAMGITPTPASAGSGPSGSMDAGGDRWRPGPGLSWQYQLSGTVDTSVRAEVFDVDAESTDSSTLNELRANGARTICYFSAGSWEPWRSDAAAFPESVKGAAMEGWPDELWLDVRQTEILLPIMEARMADCRTKGFDAVEPDNVDGYANETGFPLTPGDQRRYDEALAELAHAHGLSVGLKNTAELVEQLQPSFDFAVVEECVRYEESGMYAPFTATGKAVFHVEYAGDLTEVCAPQEEYGFSSIKKDLALGSDLQSC